MRLQYLRLPGFVRIETKPPRPTTRMSIQTADLDDLPRDLVERFADRDGVLWIGSGVSASRFEKRPDGSTVRSGVPSADALARHFRKRLAARAGSPAPEGTRLDDLAMRYQRHYGRPCLNRLLSLYRARNAIAPEFFEKLATLPDSACLFVTTNYDPFLEEALRYRSPTVVIRELGLETVTKARPIVYKVHGDAGKPDRCVVTSDDYDAWERGSGELPTIILGLFLQSVVVAIGYRGQDPHFRQLLRRANESLRATGGSARTLFVVVPDPKLDDFSPYEADSYDLVVVPRTGEEYIDWLSASLLEVKRRRAAEDLARIIDSPDVSAARIRLGATISGGEQRQQAAAYEALAAVLVERGRVREALLERARAARLWREAGSLERARQLTHAVMATALESLRDAQLADSLRGVATAIRAPLDEHVESADDAYLELAALTEIRRGIPNQPAPREFSILERRLESAPDGSERRKKLIGVVASLRAEVAVTNLDPSSAATHYEEAAANSFDMERCLHFTVRALLFGGLSGARPQASTGLAELQVPDAVDEERQRAIGWLRTVSGEVDAAISAFQTAASRAVSRGDVQTAALCYRCAEWAERQRPMAFLGAESAGQVAYRLEQALAREGARARATVGDLLRQSDYALADGELRGAVFNALAAQRLAFDDINPAGLERTWEKLASAWLPVAAEVDDGWTLELTTYFAGCCRADLKDDLAQSRLGPLRTALQTRASSDLRNEIVSMCTTDGLGPVERRGMLLLLGDLQNIMTPALLATHVVPAIERGLAASWGPVRRVDVVSAACRLAGEVSSLLTPAQACRVLEQLFDLARRTPPAYLDDVYGAVASVIGEAQLPEDGGSVWASHLLQVRESKRASRAHVDDRLAVAIARLLPRVVPELQHMLWAVLKRDAEVHHWIGFEQLARQGTDIPADLLERFLLAEAEVARMLSAPESGDSFGFRFPPWPVLTRVAATRASVPVRREAFDAALGVLKQERQWSRTKAQWVPFAVHLARSLPAHLSEMLAVLQRLAGGSYTEPGTAGVLPTHPLSSFRFARSGRELDEAALGALGALYRSSGQGAQAGIMSALRAALGSEDGTTRRAAAFSFGELLAAHEHDATDSSSFASRALAPSEAERQGESVQDEALRYILTAVIDPDPRVRDAAIEILRNGRLSSGGRPGQDDPER
jgi:hypothetical protein